MKMIKPIGGMLLVTKKQEEDKTTKSGLVISAVFNDSGPKIGTIVDMVQERSTSRAT